MTSNSIEVSVRIRPKPLNYSLRNYSSVDISENGKQILLQTPKYCTVEIVSPIKEERRISSKMHKRHKSDPGGTHLNSHSKQRGAETPKHKRSYFPKTPSRKAKSLSSYKDFHREENEDLSSTKTYGRGSSSIADPSWNVGKIQGSLFEASPSTIVPKTPARRLNRVMTSDNIFSFDNIWDEESTQEGVFSYLRPAVLNVLDGYNSSILMYGSTGSGKTWTMVGPVAQMKTPNHPDCGIIPRALDTIFEEISQRTDFEYTVTMTFVELYQDRFRNLLSSENSKGKSRVKPKRHSKSLGSRSHTHDWYGYENSSSNFRRSNSSSSGSSYGSQTITITTQRLPNDTQSSIILKGPDSLYTKVQNTVHGTKLLRHGFRKRHESSTKLNSHSSRSHAIVTLTVVGKAIDSADGLERRGKLTLVDLAGSERCKRSGANGQVLIETKYINQSLASLGNVLNALVKQTEYKRKNKPGAENIIVPYRSSKLTRYLSDSLGGNSHTKIIATIDTHVANHHETLFTLRYAERAKLIQNNLVQNNFWRGDSNYAQNFRASKALQDSLNSHRLTILKLENELSQEKQKNTEFEKQLIEFEKRRSFWQEMNGLLSDQIENSRLYAKRQLDISNWTNLANSASHTVKYSQGLSLFNHLLEQGVEEEDGSNSGVFNPQKLLKYYSGSDLLNLKDSNIPQQPSPELLAQIETDKEYIQNLQVKIQNLKQELVQLQSQNVRGGGELAKVTDLQEKLANKNGEYSELESNSKNQISRLEKDLENANMELEKLKTLQKQQEDESKMNKARLVEFQKAVANQHIAAAVPRLSFEDQQKLKKRLELETAASISRSGSETMAQGTIHVEIPPNNKLSEEVEPTTTTTGSRKRQSKRGLGIKIDNFGKSGTLDSLIFGKPRKMMQKMMLISSPLAKSGKMTQGSDENSGKENDSSMAPPRIVLPLNSLILSPKNIKVKGDLNISRLASLSPVLTKSIIKNDQFDLNIENVPEASTPRRRRSTRKAAIRANARIQESARKLRSVRGWERDAEGHSPPKLKQSRSSRRKRRKSNKNVY